MIEWELLQELLRSSPKPYLYNYQYDLTRYPFINPHHLHQLFSYIKCSPIDSRLYSIYANNYNIMTVCFEDKLDAGDIKILEACINRYNTPV